MIISLLGQIGFGDQMLTIGYEDVSQLGKVVVSIDGVRRGGSTLRQSNVSCLQDSPLNGPIIPGDTITRLNDFTLGSDLHQDLWSQYFLEPNNIPESPSTGWCIEKEWFQGNYAILVRA